MSEWPDTEDRIFISYGQFSRWIYIWRENGNRLKNWILDQLRDLENNSSLFELLDDKKALSKNIYLVIFKVKELLNTQNTFD